MGSSSRPSKVSTSVVVFFDTETELYEVGITVTIETERMQLTAGPDT